MSVLSRLLNGFLLLAALLLTGVSLSGEWLFELCSPVDVFGNRISLFEALSKGEQLSRELQSIHEITRTKDTVVDALLSGEITLFEAAVQFRSLYAEPRSWHHPFRPRPADTDGETWCREVIDWAESQARFHQSSSQADAVRQRLEGELQKQLERGSVTLPEYSGRRANHRGTETQRKQK